MTSQNEDERKRLLEDIRSRISTAAPIPTTTPTAVAGPIPAVTPRAPETSADMEDIRSRISSLDQQDQPGFLGQVWKKFLSARTAQTEQVESIRRGTLGRIAQPFTTPFSTPLQKEPTSVYERGVRPVAAVSEVVPSLIERRAKYPGQAAMRRAIGLSPIEEQQATGRMSRELLGQFVRQPFDRAGTQQIVKDLAGLQESRPFTEQLLMGLIDPLAIAPSVVSSLRAARASRKLGDELLFRGKGKGFPPAAAQAGARDLVRAPQLALPPGRTGILPSEALFPTASQPQGAIQGVEEIVRALKPPTLQKALPAPGQTANQPIPLGSGQGSALTPYYRQGVYEPVVAPPRAATPAELAQELGTVLPETAPPGAIPLGSGIPARVAPTADELGIIKKRQYYYPKNSIGEADIGSSAIHKEVIDGQDRYLTSLDYEDLGKNWYEYTGKGTQPGGSSWHPGPGGTGIYTKNELIAKLKTEAATEAAQRTEAGISSALEMGKFGRWWTKQSQEGRLNAEKLMRSTNPADHKKGVQQYNDLVAAPIRFLTDVLEKRGYKDVRVQANFGYFGGLEPSFRASVRTADPERLMADIAEIADVEFRQTSVLLYEPTTENVHRYFRGAAGAPDYSIEPIYSFRTTGGQKISGKQWSEIQKLMGPRRHTPGPQTWDDPVDLSMGPKLAWEGELGVPGFSSHADGKGFDIIHVSKYGYDVTAPKNVGYDSVRKWIARVGAFAEESKTNNELRGILAFDEKGFRKLSHYGQVESWGDFAPHVAKNTADPKHSYPWYANYYAAKSPPSGTGTGIGRALEGSPTAQYGGFYRKRFDLPPPPTEIPARGSLSPADLAGLGTGMRRVRAERAPDPFYSGLSRILPGSSRLPTRRIPQGPTAGPIDSRRAAFATERARRSATRPPTQLYDEPPTPSGTSQTTYTGRGAEEAQRLVDEGRIATERLAGQSRIPTRKPGEAVGSGGGAPPPKVPDVALGDDLGIPTHERPASTPFRKAEGAANYAGLELEEFSEAGIRLQKGLIFDEENMRPLFEALHGERSVNELSPQLQAVYGEARRILAIEEREMLDFFQKAKDLGVDEFVSFDVDNMAKRFMAHETYFPRGWKQVKEPGIPGRGRIARTAGPLRPRVEATFSELLDSGKEPLSWNPLEMVARRRMAGVNFREQSKLVTGLRTRGLVEPKALAPEGWRVPKVGVVFQGRPLPNGGTTEQLFTPSNIAGELENMYGARLEFLVGGKNILPGIKRWSNRFKRAKLFGSLFQHIDFATRLGGAVLAPSSIARGVPFKAPSLAFRLIKNSISGSSRAALRKDLLSNKPLFKDFGITNKMLIEEGWGVHGDISLIQREGVSFIQEAIQSRSLVGKPLEAAQKMSNFFESGLFRGVYREAQQFSLENFIIPTLRRQNPKASPREIAARAAEIVNLQFSTLGQWQTILKDTPHLKEFFYNMAFSFNESESLIRQALGTVKGPNKRLWVENYMGMFLGMAIVGNLINFVATGKALPLSSYSPIDIDDPYGAIKISDNRIGYNNRLLAPQAPGLQAKDGAPVYIDLVGQMDTVFQWAANPQSAVAARVNVIPRAITNQLEGETFFGEDLGRLFEPGKWPIRAAAAAEDVLAPIPVTAGLAATQAAIPQLEGIVPSGESRLPALEQAIQAIGVNLRGGTLIDQFPNAQKYFDLTTTKERTAFRKNNPTAEAVLFIEGRFGSFKSRSGPRIAQSMMRKFNISPRNVKHYEKVFGSLTLPK